MFMLKKAWLTPAGGSLFGLSLESLDPEDPIRRVRVDQHLFPNVPTESHPLKHVTVVNCLDRDDLRAIRDAITELIGA
jgi:hypothetical protein